MKPRYKHNQDDEYLGRHGTYDLWLREYSAVGLSPVLIAQSEEEEKSLSVKDLRALPDNFRDAAPEELWVALERYDALEPEE